MDFEFRPFGAEHVELMLDWLRRPHVVEWWGDTPTAEEVHREFVDGDSVYAFIVYGDGHPVGFIQSYVAMNAGDGWWPDERDPGVLGIDQFIADANLLDRGFGTAMVRAFVDRLLQDPSVARIQADPSPANLRAIRCYEKVGFESVGEIETPDGRAWYMILRR